MGSGVSAPLSAAQLQVETYTNEELRTALQGLESADLCRFLKLVGCHTLRMERSKLDGPALLTVPDEELNRLGLTPQVQVYVRLFRKEIRDAAAAAAAEKKRREEEERARELAKQKAEYEAMIQERVKAIGRGDKKSAKKKDAAGSGAGGLSEPGKGLASSPAEHAFKQYVMRRNGQATRSAKTIEMQAMEQRLQRMLRRPEASVLEKPKRLRRPPPAARASASSSPSRGGAGGRAGSPPKRGSTGGGGALRGRAKARADAEAAAKAEAEAKAKAEAEAKAAEEEPPPSPEELAALRWVEKHRRALLEARRAMRAALVRSLDDVQLSLSRVRDEARALHVRGKLMQLLGNDLQEDDVRLAKKHAGEGHWSESDEEELAEDFPTFPGLPEIKDEVEAFYKFVRDPIRRGLSRQPKLEPLAGAGGEGEVKKEASYTFDYKLGKSVEAMEEADVERTIIERQALGRDPNAVAKRIAKIKQRRLEEKVKAEARTKEEVVFYQDPDGWGADVPASTAAEEEEKEKKKQQQQEEGGVGGGGGDAAESASVRSAGGDTATSGRSGAGAASVASSGVAGGAGGAAEDLILRSVDEGAAAVGVVLQNPALDDRKYDDPDEPKHVLPFAYLDPKVAARKTQADLRAEREARRARGLDVADSDAESGPGLLDRDSVDFRSVASTDDLESTDGSSVGNNASAANAKGASGFSIGHMKSMAMAKGALGDML